MSIHDADYCHQNLKRENLILRQINAGVAIVGLGDARPMKSTQSHAKREEQERLMGLLPNPLKRTVDGNHTLSFVDLHPEVGPASGNQDTSAGRQLGVAVPRLKKRRDNV
jgi:hypothetical protein